MLNETINQDSSAQANTPLLEVGPQHSTNSAQLIRLRAISFGINGLLLSGYMAGSAKLLSELENSSGAAALVLPFQCGILAIAVGPIIATGLTMAKQIGKKNYSEAGNTIRSGWVLTVVLGLGGSALMLFPRVVFPHLFSKRTAQEAVDFFSGCAIGNVPLLMLIGDALIAFEAGDWYIPAAISALLFGSSITSSYLLGFRANLGSFGVGVGSSLGPIFVCTLMRFWFTKAPYQKYGFYKLSRIEDFKETIKPILSLGSMLALQRLTEWLNLLLITVVIGHIDDNELIAMSPAIQYVGLAAAVLQGIAAITGLLVAQNNGARESALMHPLRNENDPIFFVQRNKHIIFQTILVSIALSVLMGMVLYLSRQPAIDFFLPSNNTNNCTSGFLLNQSYSANSTTTDILAINVLYAALIGFVPDAFRIHFMGALRGFKDILFPTMVSFIAMIMVGIPVGWLIGREETNPSPIASPAAWMFHVRSIAMLISAVIIGIRCNNQFNNQMVFPSISSSRAAFFHHENDPNMTTTSPDALVSSVTTGV